MSSNQRVRRLREARIGGTLTGLGLAYKMMGEKVIDELKELPFPEGWTRDIGPGSVLFHPLRETLPCVKVTWAHGLNIESQYLVGGKPVSKTLKNLSLKGVVGAAELLMAAHG